MANTVYANKVLEAKVKDLLGSFTTSFTDSGEGRAQNVRNGCAKVNGTLLYPGDVLSVYKLVSPFTKANGYGVGGAYLNGEIIDSIGGGVCQVSTTLYNAALKAGLTIVEYHPHSLQVGYVSPSRDAMVSSGSDLRLYNPHSFPVYLSVKTTGDSVSALFYGKNEGYRYEINTVILEKIAPPIPIVKAGEEEGIIRASKEGIKSEAYLECYKNGSLLFCKRLRVDEYRPIQGIIGKKIAK